VRKLAVVAVVLALAAGSAFATALIGRNGAISKPLQAFGWLNFGYNQTAIKYNWTSSAWETPYGFVPVKTASCDVTLALGLPGKVDVDLVAPLAMKEQDTLSASGLGDVLVYARYGLLQSALLPVKAALVLGANLPTADTTVPKAVQLGDRTTDIGLAVAAVTQKYFGFVGHVRAAYWLNGKLPDTEKKVGNMVEYNVTIDYSITRTLTPELCVTGYSRAQTDSSGTLLANSEVSQHTGNVLLIWKPIPMLVIRPKVAFPLTFMSKGSTMANVYGGLDIWATVP